MGLVVPAVLPSSCKELDEKIMLFASLPGVSRIQIDVVDGHFASPASWPYTAPNELAQRVRDGEMLPYLDRIAYEIDLMCKDAEEAAAAWLSLGATRLTFHAESTTDLPRHIAEVKRRYISEITFSSELLSFGLALNIASDLALLEPCVPDISYVQFMGIAKIGVQGQPFDERAFKNIRVFRERHPDISIQVDGGVSLKNAKKLVSLGVSHLVVGSAILRAQNPAAVIEEFESLSGH